jgi:hypothetical protein
MGNADRAVDRADVLPSSRECAPKSWASCVFRSRADGHRDPEIWCREVSATAATGQLDELVRNRRAVEDTMQQPDCCTGYLYGIGKRTEPRCLGRNLHTIRAHVLNREPEPVLAGDSSTQ